MTNYIKYIIFICFLLTGAICLDSSSHIWLGFTCLFVGFFGASATYLKV